MAFCCTSGAVTYNYSNLGVLKASTLNKIEQGGSGRATYCDRQPCVICALRRFRGLLGYDQDKGLTLTLGSRDFDFLTSSLFCASTSDARFLLSWKDCGTLVDALSNERNRRTRFHSFLHSFSCLYLVRYVSSDSWSTSISEGPSVSTPLSLVARRVTTSKDSCREIMRIFKEGDCFFPNLLYSHLRISKFVNHLLQFPILASSIFEAFL